MMVRRLLVDQGNSSVKLAWEDAAGLQPLPPQHALVPVLEALEAEPHSIWVSSVADAAQRRQLLEELRARWPVPTTAVRVSDFQRHLHTRYRADQLGVDRWLAMLACASGDGAPFLVVDAGTAVTIDVLDRQGAHLGGYLLPGLKLAQQALLQGTAIAMPRRNGGQGVQGHPGETGMAISRGIEMGVVALIERLHRELDKAQPVHIGGGDADRLAACLRVPHVKVEHLVLKGLSRLASLEEN